MPRRPTDSRARAGYSVLEMLIVLGIMAMGAAIVLPRGSAMLDRVMTHVVFFELQRDISGLRREAWRAERAVTIAATAESATEPSRALRLRPNWSYRLDRPLVISSGGACPSASAEILRGSEVVMRLISADGACHFIRRD